MKFCPNCGQQLEDNDVFCANCGTNLNAVEPNVVTAPETQVEAPIPQPQYQQPQYAPPVQSSGLNQAILALKKTITSAPSIIAAVLYSLSVFFMIIVAAVSSDKLIALFVDIMRSFKINVTFTYSTQISSVISAVSANLFPLLIILGLWLTIGKAFNKRSDRMSTGGLTLIKVVMIISFISLIIVFSIILIASIVGIIALISSNSRSNAGPVVALVALFFVLVGVFIFMIVYYAKVLKTIGAAKSVAATGVPSRNASGFVAVMQFISGISGISSGFVLLASSAIFENLIREVSKSSSVDFNYSLIVDFINSGSVFLAIQTLLAALAAIFFGITIFKFKGAMNKVIRDSHR